MRPLLFVIRLRLREAGASFLAAVQRLQGDGRVGGTVSRRDRARVRPGPHGPTRKSGRSPVRQSVHSTSSGRGVRGKEKFCSELRERAVVARSHPIKLHLKPEVIFCFHFYDIKSLFKASGAVCHRFLKFARPFESGAFLRER